MLAFAVAVITVLNSHVHAQRTNLAHLKPVTASKQGICPDGNATFISWLVDGMTFPHN